VQAVSRREDKPQAAPTPEPATPAKAAPARTPLPPPSAPELQQLRRELGGMRKLFERQMASLAWRDLRERQPERLAALRVMTDLGLDARLAHAIVDELPRNIDEQRSRF